MASTLVNVLGGMAPKVEVLTQIQSALSMVVILFFSWFHFNTWAGKNFEEVLSNPPRHYTTFSRYIWYTFLYTMVIEFTYIIFLVIPGVFDVITGSYNLKLGIDPTDPGFQRNFPLWLLILLISILPNTPGLRNVELWLRTTLHRQAFIPAEAEALVNQFIIHPARFESDSDNTALVMEAIHDDIPVTHDVARPDKRLRHRWFKMSYLYSKINEWKEKKEIIQFYSFCEPKLKNCDKEYKALQLDIRSYFTSKQQLGDGISPSQLEYLDIKKTDINKKLDLLLKDTYQLICCGVLATQKTHQGRMDTFRYFGLKPDFTEGPHVYVDIILSCVFISTFLTFTATYIFHSIDPSIIKTMSQVISWTFLMLFLQGASIMVAVFVYRRLSLKNRLGGEHENAAFVCGPLTDMSIGAATGYLTGFAILLMYATIFSSNDSKNLMDLAKRIWPWPMIQATTSGFIIYYLYSLDVVRKRLTEGLIQGGCMAITAILAYIISAGLRGQAINSFFFSYCALVCCLTGFTIGWIFPEEYRRRKKADINRCNRRLNPRICVYSSGTMQIGDDKYPCQTVDLSMEGAKLSTTIPEGIGTNVLLNLTDIGAINGVIKRKEEKKIYLQFFQTDEIRKRLEAYISLYSASLV